jgi:hypothetical protein
MNLEHLCPQFILLEIFCCFCYDTVERPKIPVWASKIPISRRDQFFSAISILSHVSRDRIFQCSVKLLSPGNRLGEKVSLKNLSLIFKVGGN